MKANNQNNYDLIINNKEEVIKTLNSENSDDFRIKFTQENNKKKNSFKNLDLLGLKYYPEIKSKNDMEIEPKENIGFNQTNINNNNQIKDLSYYNKLINSLNSELGIITNNISNEKNNNINNYNIPKNNNFTKISNNKNDKKRINKNNNLENNKVNENIKGNNTKLKELENNKSFLINKNREIEDQINNLQDLAQKVNLINQKNNFYNKIYKDNSKQFITFEPQNQNKIDKNIINNYFKNEQINNNNFKTPKTVSNFIYNKDNNYCLESLEENNNENNNKYLNIEKDKINNKIKKTSKRKSISSSRNKKRSNIKKYKTFNKRKKTIEKSKSLIKSNKSNKKLSFNNTLILNNEEENLLIKKKLLKETNSQKNGFSLSIKDKGGKKRKKLLQDIKTYENEELDDKFTFIKNIILGMNGEDWNKKTKMNLVAQISELQLDFREKISSIEKYYKMEIEDKNKKIKKLEKENNDIKKKVTKIKSIV